MHVLPLISVLFLLCISSSAAADSAGDDFDSVVVDATYVPCSDSTESLLIFRSGRAIYASMDRGVIFTLTTALLDDVLTTADRVESTVDTTALDSCTTVGVILGGDRFLLINNASPTAQTREVQLRLERLRKFARKKLDETVGSMADRATTTLDTAIMASGPSVSPVELRENLRYSPVALEWKCYGSVIVRTLIGKEGDPRRAFIHRIKVRGKCGSLLVTAALRAVLRSTFKPALKKNGKPLPAWTDVEVKFTRK